MDASAGQKHDAADDAALHPYDAYRLQCPLSVSAGLTHLETVETCEVRDDFFKSFSLSSDGSFAATVSESNDLQILESDSSSIQHHAFYATAASDSALQEVKSSSYFVKKSLSLGENVYDLKWSLQSAINGKASDFITSCRDHPIQLWDASTGTMKASYCGYNHLDEVDPAVSICFNALGTHIFGGSSRVIRCFDISIPGREVSSVSTSATKRSLYGQKGIISALDANPDMSGAYAAGSFAGSVGIYAEQADDCLLHLSAMDCGVTQVRWSPCGRFLWVGGRHCDEICCFDIRNTQQVLGSVYRQLRSNQRLLFDLDPWGRYLCTGSQDGKILIYDTCTFDLSSSTSTNHGCCCNSVAFHPFCRFLFSASGERQFHTIYDSDATSSDNEIKNDENLGDGGLLSLLNKKRRRLEGDKQPSFRSCLDVWSMSLS